MSEGRARSERRGGLILACLAAFLLGCFPTGRLLSSFLERQGGGAGRGPGNGSFGASSVARNFGRGPGVLVFFVDAAKGALPVLFARSRGWGPARRGLLGALPLLAHIIVLRGRGASAGAGAALAEDPAAVAAVAPVLAGGLVIHRHAPSVLVSYLLLPPLRYLLGRSRPEVLWTAAWMGLLILARAKGGGSPLVSVKVLRERLWYDRELPKTRGS